MPATPAAPRARPRRATSPARAAAAAAEQEVRATFDALLRAVEKQDVDAVMSFYWNAPQLLIFNNNGTVTRGWAQMRANLASRWTQAQTFKDVPETSAGRMTVMFRRAGGAWKITHRHTSPEAPDPARLPASEQPAAPAAKPPAPAEA